MTFKELAHRRQNGIVVRLFWDAALDRVVLRYRDTLEGTRFSVVVAKADALEAFHHPNLYRSRAQAAVA
jgi:hypothetical protein